MLRCVAAHDSKACREFDHPDKGEWSHDEDCCAGNKQAACKAGYRYEKSGNVCFEGVTCRAYSYTCDKCTATEVADGDCDSHYDVETEDGEDYDCNINAWSACYFLWPISWVFLVVAIKQVQNLAKAGKESEARALWESRKKGAFYIFLFCTVMHFVATIWMGPSLMAILIGHCVILGVVIPLCCCLHGDKQVSATAVAPAPVSCGPGWSAHQNIDMCGQGDVEIIHNWRGKHSIEELMRKVEQNDYSAVCVGSFGHAALKKFPYQLTAGHCKPSSGYTNTLYIWSGVESGIAVPAVEEAPYMATVVCESESAREPPPLREIVDALKRNLGLDGNFEEVVNAACLQLGVPPTGSLPEKADTCWRAMEG